MPPTLPYPTSNPMSRPGVSAYGRVPGAVLPPSPFGDLSKIYPNLSGTNSQVGENIMHELRGELSPQTINSLRTRAAEFGVSSGMPGSGLAGNYGLRSLGLATEELQGKGLQDYLSAITGLSRTQTLSPELQTEIATQNSLWNAAPDPEAAAKEQEHMFEKYLNPGGGTITTEEIPTDASGKPLFASRAPTSWRY